MVTSVLLLRLAQQMRAVFRLVATGRTPNVGTSVDRDFTDCLSAQPIDRPVRLLIHSEIETPSCVGWVRPVVLWPTDADASLVGEPRRWALAHELSHLRRRDDWANLGAELLRVVFWFFVPLHWTVAQMRREQEFLSDDDAARLGQNPIEYAQLLLNLTPVGRTNLLLGHRFVSANPLPARIRRMLRNLSPTTRLHRSQRFALTLGCLALVVGAGALRLAGQEPPKPLDADLNVPTLSTIAEAWRAARSKYGVGQIEGEIRDVREKEGSDPETSPGRFRYHSDGVRWRAEMETERLRSGSNEKRPIRWSHGFDGQTHFHWDQQQGEFILGEDGGDGSVSLHDLLFTKAGVNLAKQIEADEWRVEGQRIHEGVRCLVLIRERTYPSTKQREELAISPRQDWLPVSYKQWRNDKLSHSHSLKGLKQAESGSWHPSTIVIYQDFIKKTRTIKIKKLQLGKKFAKNYFRPNPPMGEMVQDHRSGEIYVQDPWREKTRAWLKKNHNWPPADLVPLNELSAYVSDKKPLNPAPDWNVGKWLQGGPVTKADRKGKVTLLFFSTGSVIVPRPKWAGAVRALREQYAPHGYEVIGIHTHDDETGFGELNIKQLRTPWPVMRDIAPPEGARNGATFAAYGLKAYVSFVLVDHKGVAHPVEQGKLLSQVGTMLRAAGEKDLPKVSADFANAKIGMWRGLTKQWRQWSKNSPHTNRIAGNVRNAAGKPQSAVKIRLERLLVMAGSAHTTAARHIIKDPAANAETLTFEDGKFEFPKLSQGAYRLNFSTPTGLAQSRMVYVAGDGKSVDVQLEVP